MRIGNNFQVGQSLNYQRHSFTDGRSFSGSRCSDIQKKSADEASPVEATSGINVLLYQLLVRELINPAIFLVDLAGFIISWNAGVGTILGYVESDFVGRNLATLLFSDEDRHSGVPERLFQAAIAAGTISSPVRCRRKDNGYVYSSSNLTAVHSVSGAPLGVAIVLQDATSAKRREDEHTSVSDTLRQSNEDLTRLGQILAHDLRAPLRMVRSYAALLENRLDGRLDGMLASV